MHQKVLKKHYGDKKGGGDMKKGVALTNPRN